MRLRNADWQRHDGFELRCPNCSGNSVTRNGYLRSSQRFRCKECGHNFLALNAHDRPAFLEKLIQLVTVNSALKNSEREHAYLVRLLKRITRLDDRVLRDYMETATLGGFKMGTVKRVRHTLIDQKISIQFKHFSVDIVPRRRSADEKV